jgi:uncharacterized protein (TIGR02118 family)
MALLIAMYRKPDDPAAFNRYYYETHVPIAKRIPGLRGYEVTVGPILVMDGVSPYHLVANLRFDSVAAIKMALESEEGKATSADLANFAAAGVDIYIADSATV